MVNISKEKIMIRFYGFNNGKAVAVNNHKNMMNAFWITLLPALILSIIAFVFAPIALIPIWIMPIMFFQLLGWFLLQKNMMRLYFYKV